MKKTVLLLITLFSLFISNSLFSQDQIIKKNNEVINCRVREIGTTEVKYNLPDFPEDVLFSIDNAQVRKVVFASKQERLIVDELNNPDNYLDDRKNAIKIDFLSPLTGNTTFAYEHSMKPGQSFEATMGIIGLGFDPSDRDAWGTFFRIGYKFIQSPDFYFSRMRYAHLLKGGYVKPEIAFGYFTQYDSRDYWPPNNIPEREEVFTLTIQLVLGKQWIFNNSFLVDFFVGVGYGFDGGDGDYYYGYAIAPSEFPVSGSAGLKIGYLFK